MVYSKLEKLWEGTQPLESLKQIIMNSSKYLKELPDLSNALNLEEVFLSECTSLVTLPLSIQNAIRLRELRMMGCTKLESFPTHLNFESLEGLDLTECSQLRNFPQILFNSSTRLLGANHIEVEDCLWNKNLPGPDYLDCLMRCVPCKYRPEQLVRLRVRDDMLEKLWESSQALGSLENMDLSGCGNLTEIPNLSKATNLKYLKLTRCKSLVTVPSSIGNLNKLVDLDMKGCTSLEVFPTDVNLSALEIFNLSGCSRLRSFPLISRSIVNINLNDTAIEEVPCCIENFSRLTVLRMHGCKRLKNISPNIFRLSLLEIADFSECGVETAINDASVVETMSLDDHYSRIPLYRKVERIHANDFAAYSAALHKRDCLDFNNCFKLDVDARELILRSYIKPTRLPGGEVPRYFTHRALGNSLTVTLPQSSHSQDFLLFKACVVVEPGNGWPDFISCLEVRWHFRGVKGIIYMEPGLNVGKTDHLVLVSFKFRAISAPSNLDYKDVEFEFFKYKVMIKECGVRVLNVSPSPDGSDGSSERGYNQQCGEKCDVVETGRSKKLMRVTLGAELTAPKLELPLERGEASAHESPRSKIPSSSVSSRNFHGDGASSYLPFSGDRPSVYVAFSPSYPSLKEEAMCVDPMITEQQDTETRIVDLHSLYDLSFLDGDE